jgi:hypothetical protein
MIVQLCRPIAFQVGRARSLVLGVAMLSAVLYPAPAQAVEGGSAADKPVSWAASLQLKQGEQLCGASLVAQQWILTAFHCIARATPRDLNVRVGSLDRLQGGDLVGVQEIVAHPNAQFDPIQNVISGVDLALVKLDRPVTEETIVLSGPNRPSAPACECSAGEPSARPRAAAFRASFRRSDSRWPRQ